MIEFMKKAVLTGIGVAALTKDKVDELAKELVDKGKMSEQEGEKFVAEILKKSEESRQSLMKQIDKMIESAIGRMNLAKREDMEALNKEISELRLEIESLKNQAKTAE